MNQWRAAQEGLAILEREDHTNGLGWVIIIKQTVINN